jgi:hypothetical protein
MRQQVPEEPPMLPWRALLHTFSMCANCGSGDWGTTPTHDDDSGGAATAMAMCASSGIQIVQICDGYRGTGCALRALN